MAPRVVEIPAGRLRIVSGSGPAADTEVAAFRIGLTPVTNAEYAPFLSDRRAPPPPWWTDPNFDSPSQPVVGITWGEAADFCAWLCEREGDGWRLPTETEWEFAACGGLVAPRTSWGDAVPENEIPEGRLPGPWEVGRGTPNGYGVLDIGTIVHEWCSDWRGTGSGRRASRGGSWRHEIRWSAPSARSSLPPDYRYSDYGFRVARAGR